MKYDQFRQLYISSQGIDKGAIFYSISLFFSLIRNVTANGEGPSNHSLTKKIMASDHCDCVQALNSWSMTIF